MRRQDPEIAVGHYKRRHPGNRIKRRGAATYIRFAAVALAAVTACADAGPFGPQDVAGTYVLRTVRGEPLPAVLWEGDITLRVWADTLRLNADGTGSETWLLEYSGQYVWGPGRSENALQFEVRDGRLEGTYVCSGFCLAVVRPIRGVFTDTGLRLDVAMHGGEPLEFDRIYP
jgi:hypothetical protein